MEQVTSSVSLPGLAVLVYVMLQKDISVFEEI
jgi:hypothetical protein